jgi:uncharacterized DUF497 family protein
LKFEWDKKKNKINLKKHKISFEIAVHVFSDLEAITIFDDEHSIYENRWITIGKIRNANIVVVVHTDRLKNSHEYIRIISARRADKEETNFYFESIK